MRSPNLEQAIKENIVIDHLNELGFYDTEGMTYRELKRQLVIERAKVVEVGSTHNSWF